MIQVFIEVIGKCPLCGKDVIKENITMDVLVIKMDVILK